MAPGRPDGDRTIRCQGCDESDSGVPGEPVHECRPRPFDVLEKHPLAAGHVHQAEVPAAQDDQLVLGLAGRRLDVVPETPGGGLGNVLRPSMVAREVLEHRVHAAPSLDVVLDAARRAVGQLGTQVTEGGAVAGGEGLALGLAVVAQHDQVVVPRRKAAIRSRMPSTWSSPVSAASDSSRVPPTWWAISS